MNTALATPRVRLPSQKHLNGNLCILIGIAERAMAEFGPLEAARLCAELSTELRRAAQHQQIAGVIVGPLVVGPGCLIAAADWFLQTAICCWRARQ